MLALVSEIRMKNRLARTLLETYVGPHASEQILAGATTRGSGATVVTASGIRFASTETLPARRKDKVIVSIRPESFSFHDAGRQSCQSAQGTVEDIVFIGSRSFYTVRLDEQAKVRVQVQRNGRIGLPGPGERATVYWDAADVVMLPQH